MSGDSLVALRGKLGARYYDGEELKLDWTTVQPAEFAGYEGLKIDGRWENNELVHGGKFFSYCINTEDRFYMVDARLFAPGLEKEPWLRQLRIVATTFQIGR
jgi:hypothetical protein